MQPFRYRNTTVQVLAPCAQGGGQGGVQSYCPTMVTVCLPPMYSCAAVPADPENLGLLREQLAALEKIGITSVVVLPRDDASRGPLEDAIKRL